MRLIFASLLILGIAGCQSRNNQSAPSNTKEHDHNSHHHDDDMGKNMKSEHGSHQASSGLTIHVMPADVTSGQVTNFTLMVHDAKNAMLKEFEPTHEKLVHLILIDKGMSTFAHLHPEVAPDGAMTVSHAFSSGGEYYVYADVKPKGQSPATVRAKLVVKGNAAPSAPLENTVPGVVKGDGWNAKVSISSAKVGEAVVTFEFKNSDQVLSDLEPYLGAMGHLVVVNTKDGDYAHAHPDEKKTPGVVSFMVHFSKPGIYKGWGQFKRSGKVFDVPFVVHVN